MRNGQSQHAALGSGLALGHTISAPTRSRRKKKKKPSPSPSSPPTTPIFQLPSCSPTTTLDGLDGLDGFFMVGNDAEEPQDANFLFGCVPRMLRMHSLNARGRQVQCYPRFSVAEPTERAPVMLARLMGSSTSHHDVSSPLLVLTLSPPTQIRPRDWPTRLRPTCELDLARHGPSVPLVLVAVVGRPGGEGRVCSASHACTG
ncbi:hypothetical protein RJ55_02050 [Drechmeria coniospora]|nr:hypothetical protein RJ55_02050 [Drechmeria coniospora]